jgi:hypothetical protein
MNDSVAMMPNPSVKGDAQQRATSSAWGASHVTPSSRRVTLSVAPYLNRSASQMKLLDAPTP